MLAGVEAVGIARFSEELFGLGGIVDRLRRRPKILEGVGDDAAGNLRIAAGDRRVNAFAIDRQARRAAHALVMPGRLRVPLLREVNPPRPLGDDWLEGQPRSAF